LKPASAQIAKSDAAETEMLIFDQLRKNDMQLQLLAAVICCGLLVLVTGLWWVQIVNAGRYRESIEAQSFRTVRLSATRGKIMDRNGVALADNRPTYNINLYLEELSQAFRTEYKKIRPRNIVTNDLPFWKEWLGLSPFKTNYPPVKGDSLEREARLRVAGRTATQVSAVIRAPVTINSTNFHRHYATALSMPYPLVKDVTPGAVSLFEEQPIGSGLDLEIQSRRIYPHSNVAAHVIGYVRADDSSANDELAYFSYRMPDYRGVVGIEGAHDSSLRGRAGVKSVQVNSLSYRQAETIWESVVPGTNIILTLDLDVQRASEGALRKQIGAGGRGAVVVMDVNSGDILALASNPTFSPNQFAHGISHADYKELKRLTAENNRATAENYQAGSVFKTIVALAALETPQSGFNPNAMYRVQPNPARPDRGIIYIGKDSWKDTVTPGDYDLRRAIAKSSNAYFIDAGLKPGVFERVVELGRRLHLGERFDTNAVPLRQQTPGHFPTAQRVAKKDWRDGHSANICIGQGAMDVTPLQIAVMTSALANGGKVLNPRFVERFEANDSTGLATPIVPPRSQVRDHLGVSKRSMDILHEAMLSETESDEGTGRHVQGCGFRVCGKTGTAERNETRADGQKKNTTWFASYAPYESPRYAVVVMVEDGQSGGATCVPIAKEIYTALKAFETKNINGAITATTR
jgi:penicillin-binding protein 2